MSAAGDHRVPDDTDWRDDVHAIIRQAEPGKQDVIDLVQAVRARIRVAGSNRARVWSWPPGNFRAAAKAESTAACAAAWAQPAGR